MFYPQSFPYNNQFFVSFFASKPLNITLIICLQVSTSPYCSTLSPGSKSLCPDRVIQTRQNTARHDTCSILQLYLVQADGPGCVYCIRLMIQLLCLDSTHLINTNQSYILHFKFNNL